MAGLGALALALTLSLGAIGGASAEERAGDVEAGRMIAERLCAGCHAIGPDDESSHEAAPPLRAFAERWPLEYLEEAFAEGIVVGHHEVTMPEFVFEPEEIDDLLAYLGAIGQE